MLMSGGWSVEVGKMRRGLSGGGFADENDY